MQTNSPLHKLIVENSFSTRDESVPFSEIKVTDYMPALKEALELARSRIKAIKENSEDPSFSNTIEALEFSGEEFEKIAGIYFNLFSAEASVEHQALAKEISPLLAAFSSEVTLDEDLFKRIKTVHEKKESLQLSVEQKRLLEKYFTDFSKNGALLSSEQKKQLTDLDQKLSVLAPLYSENVLKATNAFELWVTDTSDLKGLPDSSIEAAAAAAAQKGQPGKWLFTLQAPSMIPFMQYAENRELRKKLWLANSTKCFGGEFDNQENVKKIVNLRRERAQLLGFKSHAEFTLSERMASSETEVLNFLNRLLRPSKKAAETDIAELREFRQATEGRSTTSMEVMPWDFLFYSEKLKEKKYAFNEEELRPYFKLENVVEGVFEHARRLYSLQFKEVFDIQKYHEDVRVYEVRDSKSQNYIGLLYTDFFPRETKKSGAWMTSFRDQGMSQGEVKRPHISIVCNFTKPVGLKPSLLTYDEVQTLFHEFGHALHGLLSQCTYRSVSGTSVYWDFVELPSQIMENWVQEKEGLDVFARHYQTQEAIPAELVEKIKRSQKFQAGYGSMRQLNFAFLDMKWHMLTEPFTGSVSDFEITATEPTRVLPRIEGTNTSCSFSHIFAGGYSAGYYSYKWAEVLDADAFEFFKEKGLFNAEVAQAFKENILARGGSEHPMELYKKFRGREPDPNALLRRDGLT